MRRLLMFGAARLAVGLFVGCPKDDAWKVALSEESVVEEKPGVDLDFPSMNATVGTARLVGLLRSPQAHAGRTVRVTGEAMDEKDENGKFHYGIAIYDQGGCCPLAMIEYVPAMTNALPQEGERIVLTGTVAIPTEPAYSHFIITGATVRQLNSN